MTFEEMEQTLVRLPRLQENNQQLLHETLGAMGKLHGLLVRFAEHSQLSMDRLEARIVQLAEEQHASLLKLEGLIEAFIRGSHNGGKQDA